MKDYYSDKEYPDSGVVVHSVSQALILHLLIHTILLGFLWLAIKNESAILIVFLASAEIYTVYKSVHFLVNGKTVFSFDERGITYGSDRIYGQRKYFQIEWSSISRVKFKNYPVMNSSAVTYSVFPIDFDLKHTTVFKKPAYGRVSKDSEPKTIRFRIPVRRRSNIFEIIDTLKSHISTTGSNEN